MIPTRTLLFCALVQAASWPVQAAEAPPAARLRWLNGETLPGTIVGGSPEHLRWQSPLFQEPSEIAWSSLRRIDQNLPTVALQAGFAASMRDGSQVQGELVAVTENEVILQTVRHGEVALKRAEVLRVRRLRGPGVVWAGPVGDVGWKLDRQSSIFRNIGVQPPASVLQIVSGPGGTLELPYWNRKAVLECKLPGRFWVKLEAGSSERLDFQISFGQYKIETWGEELVVSRGDEFYSLCPLGADVRRTSLWVRIDETTGEGAAWDGEGRPLGSWKFASGGGGASGGDRVQVWNRGRDLVLEDLTFTEWSEQVPVVTAPGNPRVELVNGAVHAADKLRITAGFVILDAPGEGPARSVPLASLQRFILSGEAPSRAEQPFMLTYADGTLLRGQMQEIGGDRLMLQTRFSHAPLSSRLEGLRQLMLNVPRQGGTPPEPPFGQTDKLVLSGTSLHGRMEPSGGPGLRWHLLGAVQPNTPVAGASLEITRVLAPAPPDAKPEPLSLVYTLGGDVLPARIGAMDRHGVELDSTVVGLKNLPATQLAAVQFEAAAAQDIRGFVDPGWQVVRGASSSVKREEKKLVMPVGTSVAHWSAMQSSEVKFSLAPASYATLRMRLFASGGEDKDCLTVILANFGSQVYSGLEADDNQLNDRNQLSGTGNKAVNVRLVVQERHVELFLNGTRQHRFAVEAHRRQGMGLILEPYSVWGNEVREVQLQDFSTKASVGVPALPVVSQEARTQVLTVPRFRKENPPRHALVAMNGDVLRGEIEASTATHLAVRSGVETLKVPRSRVRAAVWLQPPVAGVPAFADDQQPELPLLDRKVSRRVSYGGAGFSTLLNAVKNDVPEVKFEVPSSVAGSSVSFNFNGQTVREALTEICRLFGLTFQVKPGNVVLVEKSSVLSSEMKFAAYWLKPAALPEAASTRLALLREDIAFPAGAAAAWDPASGLLTMSNFQEHHERLREVAGRKWGGVQGTPTHWVVLASGGRLALQVTRFDEKEILGNHPLYGPCRLPMDQVYMVRTQPPPPTHAVKALAGWRLVPAPEPVITGTEAAEDAATGKDAAPLKLALLGGGDFDLSAYKGRVVVLDFWATWCGPCIKSLPGLIETAGAYPEDKVVLLGVNQGEAADHIKTFIETRNWKLKVALDPSQAAGKAYGVTGIPHTVVVGPDGKVALVRSGFSPENEQAVAAIIKKLVPP